MQTRNIVLGVLITVSAVQSVALWNLQARVTALATGAGSNAPKTEEARAPRVSPGLEGPAARSVPSFAVHRGAAAGSPATKEAILEAVDRARDAERARMIGRVTENLKNQLELTPDAAARLETVLTSAHEKQRELREKLDFGELNRADLNQALFSVREETTKEVEAILTPQKMSQVYEFMRQHPEFTARNLFGLASSGNSAFALRRPAPAASAGIPQ